MITTTTTTTEEATIIIHTNSDENVKPWHDISDYKERPRRRQGRPSKTWSVVLWLIKNNNKMNVSKLTVKRQEQLSQQGQLFELLLMDLVN